MKKKQRAHTCPIRSINHALSKDHIFEVCIILSVCQSFCNSMTYFVLFNTTFWFLRENPRKMYKWLSNVCCDHFFLVGNRERLRSVHFNPSDCHMVEKFCKQTNLSGFWKYFTQSARSWQASGRTKVKRIWPLQAIPTFWVQFSMYKVELLDSKSRWNIYFALWLFRWQRERACGLAMKKVLSSNPWRVNAWARIRMQTNRLCM